MNICIISSSFNILSSDIIKMNPSLQKMIYKSEDVRTHVRPEIRITNHDQDLNSRERIQYYQAKSPVANKTTGK